ncbi:hypothetical protein IRV09_26280, partial [Bacillus cereus]|uniref:hypothetical protein n=1 Tax=Bacillus cereus TaxID=1396 RepID=UPI0019289E20
MDFLLNLLQDAVKIFFTVFVTAYANKLVKKLGSKRKRTAPKMNWTRKVRHIFKQLIRIEFCILQEAIL